MKNPITSDLGKIKFPRFLKIKLPRFMTMAQYAWFVFDRELSHYDLADTMHMMCPPRKWFSLDFLGGFIINITPGIPYEPITRENLSARWHKQISQIKKIRKPFDFWAVFQGEKLPSGPGYHLGDCQMSKEEYDYMIREVGNLFLGWEIGEFDGLYGRDVIYYLKDEERPRTRREAHDRFITYLKDMHQKLYGNTNALCGVTFPHYFNELPTRMLGAEVAQGLLNTQVYISFLRGACRQYDLQYKIMSSVFDRWGYRCYTDSEDVKMPTDGGIGAWKAGPYFGHSVGLLQAIWITSYFAEAAIVGLDGGFYTDELSNGVRRLSPLGQAFIEFTKWSRNPYHRGSQVRPVALMLDYYAGWTPPRHLYSFQERVVWHSIPYGPADHGMDQVYNLFYPDYCQAGYYRDERGFITPTPLGDIVDVLLSDATKKIMETYPVICFLSDEASDKDLLERLKIYVEDGGHLIISGKPMLSFAREYLKIEIPEKRGPAILSVISETKEEVREAFFSIRALKNIPGWTIYATTEKGLPLIMWRNYGKGRITFLASDHGLTDDMTAPGFDMNHSLDYRPDPPFELLHSVQRYIKEQVMALLPVTIEGGDIYYSINALDNGNYIVCLYNPGTERWTGKINLKDKKGQLKQIKGPWSGGEMLNDSLVSLKGNETAVFALSSETAR